MYIIFLYVELNHIVVIEAKKNDASDEALLIRIYIVFLEEKNSGVQVVERKL